MKISLQKKYFLCVFALYAGTLFFSFKYLTNDYLVNKYKAVGYTPNHVVFLDLAGVLNGIKSKKEGYNPYINNFYDTKHRPFNYPSVWLSLGRFSFINIDNIYLIGCIVYALFLICYCYALTPVNKKEFLIYFSLLLCPTVIFLVERCNTDIFIFILSVAMLYCLSKATNLLYLIAGSACIAIATILKIYPIVYLLLFPFLPIPWKRKIISVAFILTIIAVYFFFDYETIRYAYINTPQVQEIPQVGNFMYGSDILFSTAGMLFDIKNINAFYGKLVCLLISVLLMLFAIISFRKNPLKELNIDIKILSFLAGSIIFCSTFFIGNNWNYRLVFLVFTLPLLLSEEASGFIKYKKQIAYLILYVFWNYLFTFTFPFIIQQFHSVETLILVKNTYTVFFDELPNWILFSIFCYINVGLLYNQFFSKAKHNSV